ncbi:MAG: SDR family NAD(P)-dependent oxidoreductase [Bacteroidales bacterium]|jgi:3-oxoacyl-[acyl-carrier-protein] synthase-3|nr:SDR family NAD(P)-dependent oxidoreductase [Bacteroidales bacterium]
MVYENFIFSGFGYSAGQYKINNSDISEAVDKEFLTGFSKKRIEESQKYREYKKNNKDAFPLGYFAGEVMGFSERYNVAPFPPTRKKFYYSETSLELGVKAISNALTDAKVYPDEIDAWFISTVSPHEQAPGIAATIKAFFTGFENTNPAFTIASGCAGFNMNLEKAIQYFNLHPEAKHIVVAHTETMSLFLTQRIKFVPFVTFGDTAAAVILSRITGNEKSGIINIVNYQDLNMLDYVGVDSKWNLYMDDKLIKDRAIVNIPFASNNCLNFSGWKTDDIDWFVPHQTGNIILKPAAESLNIPLEKVFLYAQNNYGNVSGSTVPLSFALLNEQNRLQENTRILSATAGVGGNYGAFTYIHKNCDKQNNYYIHKDDLKNKNVLVLGASGSVGMNVSRELEKRGANLWLHANKNINKLNEFKNAEKFVCDFTDDYSVNDFINKLKNSNIEFDYLIKVSGSIDENTSLYVNFYSPVKIINSIIDRIKKAIVNFGSATEDICLNENDSWVSSNRAFHGYLSSASGEFFKYGIRTIYLQSGFLNKGIIERLNEKNVFRFMMNVGQNDLLNIETIANDIVKSVYLPKILHVQYCYENAMLLGRIGYKLEVDV